MERIAQSRGYRVIAMAFALVLLLSAGSAYVVFGSSHDVVIYACLNPGGQLSSVTTGVAPNCPGQSALISWNQTGPQGLPGKKGDPGEKGDKGDPGEMGPAGLTNVVRIDNPISVPANNTSGGITSCVIDEGETEESMTLIGGGVSVVNPTAPITVVHSYPSVLDDGTPWAWVAALRNDSNATMPATVYALCASP